ncbi:MAG: molybdopterin-dependent oxidoreductase [Coriobacteriales bacterium]|nr:molybdopterin-dependent oxidoreductase [Coriobacteriales bacterium]
MASAEKVTYTICQGAGCHEQCVLKVVSKDGKVVRTERPIFKGSKKDLASLCQKGICAGKLNYVPERLLYPLKRVGKRGEGKFERIPWDQALEEIGQKLRDIRAKYGDASLVVNAFPCGLPLNMHGSLTMALCYRFMNLSGASFWQPPLDMEGFQSNLVDFGNMNLAMQMNSSYWSRHRPNYVLIWGGNPIGWARAAHTSKMFMDIQEQGTKLVDIGLIFDSTAAKCDEFININPGTDAALALAMANIIIQDKRYDIDFLNTYTVAPFLVRVDNGMFLRKRDIVAEAAVDERHERVWDSSSNGFYLKDATAIAATTAEGNKYVAWDAQAQEPVFIAARDNDMEGKTPDIHAEVVVEGIACKTAFIMLKESLAGWTPEKQAETTGVSAETCRQIINDYLDNSPSGLFTYWGLRYVNAGQTLRAINLLAILSGNLGQKNGRLINCGDTTGYTVPLDGEIFLPDGDISKVKSHLIHLTD